MIDCKIITILAIVVAIALALVLSLLSNPSAAESDTTRRPGSLASLSPLTLTQRGLVSGLDIVPGSHLCVCVCPFKVP